MGPYFITGESQGLTFVETPSWFPGIERILNESRLKMISVFFAG